MSLSYLNNFDVEIDANIKMIYEKLNLTQRQIYLFESIYVNDALRNKKCIKSNHNNYHEWILLQDLIYTKLGVYPENIMDQHVSLHDEEALYNKKEKTYIFMTLPYFNEPRFVFFKTLEIGKFSPYTSV
jgi:hypothetical protein